MLLHIALHFAIIEEWQTATEETKMNRTQLIAYVQERMGSEATQAEAACMVELLDIAGYITRDGSGLVSVDTSEIPDREWMAMLAEVSA